MKLLLRASLVLLMNVALARAVTITGTDYGGADLTVSNNDVLKGTFTNVGLFTVPAGARVTVDAGTPLLIYASTVAVHGFIDGSGRGDSGGSGGLAGNSGQNGEGSGPGAGGTSGDGGGGGGGAGSGGAGSGNTAGAGGSSYGASGAETAPISSDDTRMGSGGGGGAGNSSKTGGAGGDGGAAIYIEASSMTITGTLSVDGSTATDVTDNAVGAHPAAGGGGGGGTVVLRVTGQLELSVASVTASGGRGGHVATALGGTIQPGGGGSGGRVKLFYNSASAAAFNVTISTAWGTIGGNGGVGGGTSETLPVTGATGTVAFGTVASPPSALTPFDVGGTSITWSWTATPAFGDGGNNSYRLYPATVTAPFPGAEATAGGGATQVIVTGLTPNTTYNRMLTARTDWGDSRPAMAVSTFTHAVAPAANGFSATADSSLTFAWTAPTNPSYTSYSVERALDSGFTTPVVSSVVGLSSAAANLLPNTTYFFRARAVSLAGIPTAYTAGTATATLSAVPSAAATAGVGITSASFNWAAAGNPAGTLYQAQISTNGFLTLNDSSMTLTNSATFFSLAPGTEYFFRVRSFNHNSVPSSFTTAISTRPGNLGPATPPTTPGTPVSDRQFSYDGSAVFSWDAASSAVGILDYDFFVGSTPGGSDILNVSTTSTFYPVTGLATGRTYYARVRATSNGGVDGPFSEVSAGLPVFITNQSATIPKPINWPNPFDPAQGPTQIGFFNEQDGDVTLRLYTLQGKKVYEETRFFAAGNQIFPWNGNSSSGGRVAPGGYVGLLDKGPGRTQKFKLAVLY